MNCSLSRLPINIGTSPEFEVLWLTGMLAGSALMLACGWLVWAGDVYSGFSALTEMAERVL